MKRITKTLAVALFFLVAASSQAVPYLDLNGNQTGPVWLNGNNPSTTWTFNLDNDSLQLGDINPGDTINSASLMLAVIDDEPLDIIYQEFATIALDGSTVFSGEVDAGLFTFDVLTWVSDHILNVTISNVRGDFGVLFVKLYGDYSTQCPEPVVPEPATLALIGLGLSGLGVLKRKKILARLA